MLIIVSVVSVVIVAPFELILFRISCSTGWLCLRLVLILFSMWFRVFASVNLKLVSRLDWCVLGAVTIGFGCVRMLWCSCCRSRWRVSSLLKVSCVRVGRCLVSSVVMLVLGGG